MKKLVFLAFCLCSAVAFAQDEVSLVVSADGATKTQAIDNALRSAIEQTYGTFVSANTQILNDELVRDEIATVSSGNIQKYKEMAVVTLPNGNISVTLNVTVSLKKLIKYAKSKGSECEFAGATFGANRRLYEFNKRNEMVAIKNMIKQLDALRPVYDYEIEVSDPVINSNGRDATIKMQVTASSNKKTKIFNEIIEKTIMTLAMSEKQVKPMIETGLTFAKYRIAFGKRDDIIKRLCSKKEDNDYFYFYNNISDSVTYYVIDALLDYSVTDNIGGEYITTIKYTDFSNSPFNVFGHLITNQGGGKIFDSYSIKFDYNEYYKGEKLSLIALFTDKIQGKTPLLSFSVPVESIEKISKIKIVPSRNERTTALKKERGKPFTYPKVVSQYNDK